MEPFGTCRRTKWRPSVLDTTARWVALAVVTLQSLLDLELIVFGGSIGVRPELYERVRRALPAPLLTTHYHCTQPACDRAGLIGAAWAAAQALRQNPEPAVVRSAKIDGKSPVPSAPQ